jgi:integrase
MARPRRDGTPPQATRRKRLTEFDVRRTRPEATSFQIWDTDVKGLCVRVQPTGQRSFFVVYTRGGRPRWYHVGDTARIGLSDAREIALEVNLQVIRGEDPVADRRAERGQNTLGEVHRRYVEQHAKRKNKSWKQGEWLIKQYALPRLGNLPVKDVTRAEVRATVGLIDKPVLANQVLANLSAVFSWAMTQDLVTANPCKGITYNPVVSRERVLSDDELPRFWAALDDSVQARALKAVLLLGQRPGEVTRMRREHVVGNWWQMPGAPDPATGWPGTKNGDSHDVWLPQRVRELIGEGAAGFVFESGKGGAVTKVDKLMRRICKETGIERATPHDLRRTHQTLLARCGHSGDLIDKIGNHRMRRIRRVYNRYDYRPQIQRAMEVTATFIMDLVEGRRPDNVVAMVR